MESGNRSNRSGLYFFLGVAAGAFAGWYLNSDRGRKLRHESAETLSDWSHKAAESAQSMVEKSTAYAEEVARKAHEAALKARQNAKEMMETHN